MNALRGPSAEDGEVPERWSHQPRTYTFLPPRCTYVYGSVKRGLACGVMVSGGYQNGDNINAAVVSRDGGKNVDHLRFGNLGVRP